LDEEAERSSWILDLEEKSAAAATVGVVLGDACVETAVGRIGHGHFGEFYRVVLFGIARMGAAMIEADHVHANTRGEHDLFVTVDDIDATAIDAVSFDLIQRRDTADDAVPS